MVPCNRTDLRTLQHSLASRFWKRKEKQATFLQIYWQSRLGERQEGGVRESEKEREKGGSEREGKSFLKAATKVFSLVRIKIYAKQEFQEEDERKKLLERVVRSKVK